MNRPDYSGALAFARTAGAAVGEGPGGARAGDNAPPGSDDAPGTAGAGPVQLLVPHALAGRRLDQALATLLPSHSRSRIKQWIDAGRVHVDGRDAAPRDVLHGGEQVRIDVPAAPPLADAPEAMALVVVHEDDSILVVDKPAGLVVHPGSGNASGTLLNGLLHRLPAQAALPRAGIVHRLDKDTSGLMVVAKTEASYHALVAALAAHDVAREYLAVARGSIARAITIDAPIGRHPVNRTAMAVVERGKPARTHVTPVEALGVATLVRCRLETGRTHQIRVHLAAAGHPLVGDREYGGRRAAGGVLAFARQALHATRLALAHPITGAPLAFAAPPPVDFATLVETLRHHARAPGRSDR